MENGLGGRSPLHLWCHVLNAGGDNGHEHSADSGGLSRSGQLCYRGLHREARPGTVTRGFSMTGFYTYPEHTPITIAMQGQVVSIWTVSHHACESFLRHISFV
jgi:hypothetical protein